MAQSRPDSSDEAPPDPIPAGLRNGARFTVYVLTIILGIAVAGYLAIQMAEIVVPFLVGIILSALLVPISSFLQRHRWPKWLAVLSVWLLILGLLGGLVVLIVFQIKNELPSIEKQVTDAIDSVQQYLGTHPFGLTEDNINDFIASVGNWLQDHAAGIRAGAAEVGTTAAHIAEGIIIVLFVTLFALLDGRRMWSWAVRIWPRRSHARIRAAGEAGWKTLSSFIRIQLVVAAVDAVGIGVGALILGIPLAVPIATVVFLGAFIPFVGAIIGGVVAVGLALLFNGWVHALIMLGIVVLVQQVESHALQPLLTGSRVKVHPLGVILGVTAGAAVAGVIGAFFAVPAIATVNSMIIAAKRQSDPERPDTSGSSHDEGDQHPHSTPPHSGDRR